ncbi:MAG: HD domain-containing protein, partial [Carnobacterium sp.]|nr:HD domain-containing protein [Carnobacterium sp.]
MSEPKWKQDLEYVALIEDLLDREEVKKLKNYTQHHFTTRLEHSISVSYLSYRIAKKYGLDTRSTARAGLLHDLFYYD